MPTYEFYCKKCANRTELVMRFAEFHYPTCANCLGTMTQTYFTPYISPFIASKDPWTGHSTALGENTTGRADFMQKCKNKGLSYVGSDYEPSVNRRRKELKEAVMDGEPIG